jgi:hypothetical protein
MSDTEKQTLKELFSKKFNILIGSIFTVLGIFIALFITFMIQNSKNDGIQDTKIDNIAKLTEENANQIKDIAKAVNVLITDNEVKRAEYKSLLETITETNNKAQKIEWAVLTNDKSIITRSQKVTKNNN